MITPMTNKMIIFTIPFANITLLCELIFHGMCNAY